MPIPSSRTTRVGSAALLIGVLALCGCSSPAGNDAGSGSGSEAPPTGQQSSTPGPGSENPGMAPESTNTPASSAAEPPSSDGTPDAAPNASSSSPSTLPTGGASEPAAEPIPTSAVDYADALIRAWGTGRQERMAQLARPAALHALQDYGSSGGSHWKQVGHDAGAGSVFVRYRNSRDGATVELRVRNEAASKGQEHAVAEARFEG